MLTARDLMNPTIRNKESALCITADTRLASLDIQPLMKLRHEFVNVADGEGGPVIGAIKTEKLCYILLKQAQIDFKQVLDTLDVGIVMIDRDSRIYYINRAYCKILGVNTAKILGRYMNIIEPDARLLKVLKTGEAVYVENLVKSVTTLVSASLFPIKEDGRITGAFSVFTDVTQINLLHNEVRRISAVAQEYSEQIQDQSLLKKYRVNSSCKAYRDCLDKALKVARTDAMVLVRGENGTGKEVITKIIQESSLRKDKPFITVNCSAIPESLIESELFGYEEGSFTGASKGGKMGKFQLADGGTLFLDEIGDMPYYMQAKLLRVLQEGEIEKVGRQNNIPINVRVIAATNKPLEEMVEEGSFRRDLYYRLNVVSITVPPLRERGNDILRLADEFLLHYCYKYEKQLTFDSRVYQSFLEYQWPGNVRELKNTIESMTVLCDGRQIRLQDLPETIARHVPAENAPAVTGPAAAASSESDAFYATLKEEVEKFEQHVIETVLRQNGGDKEKTMEQLAISRRTFYRKHAKTDTF